jgi:hypothetical protein
MGNSFSIPAHIEQANSVDMGDGILQQKVRRVRKATQAPESMVLQAALGIGSFALGQQLRVKAPNGQIIKPQIFCIGIAESGERKTTVLNAFTDPISEFMEDQEIKNSEILKKYERDLEVWQVTRRKIISAIARQQVE